jgi:hypothetical protein
MLSHFDGKEPPMAHSPTGPAGRLVALVAVVVAAGALASSAAADQPKRTEATESFTNTVTDICPFPVRIDSTVTFTLLEFFDKNGVQTRGYIHAVEQDTFSANGKTLTGLPFTFNLDFLFDESGNITNVFSNGLVEKVRLPDGSLFLSAGRFDFVARGNPPFVITPDKGRSGNIAAFCAALSP